MAMDPRCTHIDRSTKAGIGMDTPANPAAAFQNQHRRASIGKRSCSRQTRHACADHQHVLWRGRTTVGLSASAECKAGSKAPENAVRRVIEMAMLTGETKMDTRSSFSWTSKARLTTLRILLGI
jgi:hypothetical protein